MYSWGLAGDTKHLMASSPPLEKKCPSLNPWGDAGKSQSKGDSKVMRFSEIVLDELEQREELIKMTNKPLASIQVYNEQ